MSWPFGNNCILSFVRHHNINIKDQWYMTFKYYYLNASIINIKPLYDGILKYLMPLTNIQMPRYS